MVFGWWKRRRRRKLLARPMDPAWRYHLQALSFFDALTADERERLADNVRVFVAEKRWTPCAGVVLNDRMRVEIAAQAMRMVLHRPHDYYRQVKELLIYPETWEVEQRQPGLPLIGSMPIAGQAVHRGPIMLSWGDVERGTRRPDDGYNVVYHEFAHALDFQDGLIDGTPALADPVLRQRWVAVMSERFDELVGAARRGRQGGCAITGQRTPRSFSRWPRRHFSRSRSPCAGGCRIFTRFCRPATDRIRPPAAGHGESV